MIEWAWPLSPGFVQTHERKVFLNTLSWNISKCYMLVVDQLIFYFLNFLTFLPLPFFPAECLSASFFIWKKVFFSPLGLTTYFIYNQTLFLYISCDLSSAFKQVSLLESPNLKVIDSSLTFPELFALLKDVF